MSGNIDFTTLTATASSGVALDGINWTKIPLTTIFSSKGTKLSLSDGSILVGSNVSYVKVSAQVLFNPNVANGDLISIRIYKNNTFIKNTFVKAAGNFTTITSSPILIPVQAGDTISLYARDENTTNVSAGAPDYSYITVEEC